MGIVSAINKDNIIDKFVLFFSALGMSLPSFLVLFSLLGFLDLFYTNILIYK